MNAHSLGILLLLFSTTQLHADPIFSGPQVGEKLSNFQVRRVFDEKAGSSFDPVKLAAEKPIALVFVHDFTRPSLRLVRAVMTYAAQRKKNGLASCIVFLSDDVTKSEGLLRRARHALPQGVDIGISLDGPEGPGSYGLNRKVTLTVLVGAKGKVIANFAIVQPDMQEYAVPIAKAMVKAAGGGQVPTLAALIAGERTMEPPRYRELIGPVINKTATDEQVVAAAQAVEKHAAQHPVFARYVQRAASRIVLSGRIDTYGTPKARDYIRKWAREPAEGKKESSTTSAAQKEGNSE